MNGNTVIGTNTYPFTVTVPESVKPAVPAPDLAQGNTNVPDALGNTFIKGVSSIAFALAGTAGEGSTIKNWKLEIDGDTYSGEKANWTTWLLRSSGDIIYTVTATDARGRTGTYSGTVHVHDYALPTIEKTEVYRCKTTGEQDDEGTCFALKVIYTATALTDTGGAAINTITAKTRYKPDNGAWGDAYTTIANNTIAVFGNETITDAAYDIEIVVDDGLNTTTMIIDLAPRFRFINVNALLKSIAIGMVATRESAFEVSEALNFYYGSQNVKTLLSAIAALSDMVDYPIERGRTTVDGIVWDYAKYKSGWCEMDANIPVSNVAASTQWGTSGWYIAYIPSVNYPFTFSVTDGKYPHQDQTWLANTDSTFMLANGTSNPANASRTGGFSLIRYGTGTANGAIKVEVKGYLA